MPVTAWKDVIGHQCEECGDPATHIYGGGIYVAPVMAAILSPTMKLLKSIVRLLLMLYVLGQKRIRKRLAQSMIVATLAYL